MDFFSSRRDPVGRENRNYEFGLLTDTVTFFEFHEKLTCRIRETENINFGLA